MSENQGAWFPAYTHYLLFREIKGQQSSVGHLENVLDKSQLPSESPRVRL